MIQLKSEERELLRDFTQTEQFSALIKAMEEILEAKKRGVLSCRLEDLRDTRCSFDGYQGMYSELVNYLRRLKKDDRHT